MTPEQPNLSRFVPRDAQERRRVFMALFRSLAPAEPSRTGDSSGESQ